MTDHTAFMFVEPRGWWASHIRAFDPDAQRWDLMCEGDDVGDSCATYAPTKPLCNVCAVLSSLAAASIEDVRAVWPTVVGEVRDSVSRRRWALLRVVEPIEVSDGHLILGVPHDFHLSALISDDECEWAVIRSLGRHLQAWVPVKYWKTIEGTAG